ncbi:protransforming growth factor alpha [Mastacembelus armatus]|uniref:Transforming growth factor, alpha n=1 Tax=Mastacembelus armatus TaxID=205130 RepID=A0A7N8Y5X0_9TELE|nr:protransforming growth factor alpha [Mastacembelus armatus]
MTRIFWDAFFLISGSLFTFGAEPNNSTTEASISIHINSSATTDTFINSPATPGHTNMTTIATTIDRPMVKGSHLMFGAAQTSSAFIDTNSSAAPLLTANNSATASRRNTTTRTIAVAMTSISPVKKFVAAAVRSHFDDCPDSHRHFCLHGTCRFLILEETPACVCQQGFVGMRCEHADLLAVVATNHRQHTVATLLVLCVIGCVLIMVVCTLLHCWWRQGCRRRSYAHHYASEKHRASCYPSESVV